MINKELSETLGFAVREAKKRRHEYVSIEHVLFAILHDRTGVEIIENCGGNVENLKRRLAALSRQNRIALVFGPEDSGLTNEDVRLCHSLVTIPTADFSSLNLAQAVMVLCYELFLAVQEEKPPHVPRLATRHELDGMYAQLKDVLVRISYINPENPEYWLDRLRHFFSRVGLRAADVSIIRGICRQIDWYAGKRYRDGLSAGGGPPQDPSRNRS